MKRDIKITHSPTSFTERFKYWLLTFAFILTMGFVIFALKNGRENLVIWMAIFAAIIGAYIAFIIWRGRLYIVDFESDSLKVQIRYFNGRKEQKLNSFLKDIEIKLKNTSTRFGFDCELQLRIDKKKFVIKDTFDWSLLEMKNLFEYVKHFKNEPLIDRDKSNVYRIDKKIEKFG